MAKCQIVAKGKTGDVQTFAVSQKGWRDAVAAASDLARKAGNVTWASSVELKCGAGKAGTVKMYDCRIDHFEKNPFVPSLVHCQLDVTSSGSKAIAGRRKKRR